MNRAHRIRKVVGAGLSVAALVLAGCAGMSSGHKVNVVLRGSEEVPAVTTAASGSGTITIAADKSVSGSVTTTGLGGVAAHIHQGARGQNGPIAVGLVKTGENVWSVPAGAKLTDAQYDGFKAGNLYVNVHTPANKGGEIRGQMNP
jgi:hypothetical protein